VALRPAHLNAIAFDRPYFGWVLRNPTRVRPIPYRGGLGLMKIPASIAAGGPHVQS
jgi:hypothetical protein